MISRRSLFALILASTVCLSACAGTGLQKSRYSFPLPGNEAALLAEGLGRAAEQDKLALIVAAAAWCHDTDAFLDHLMVPETSALVADHYEVTLINVGALTHGSRVASLIGLPVPTHTPTVLIIDPKTGQVINAHDHHTFRDAAKNGAAATHAHLRDKAGGQNLAPTLTQAQRQNAALRQALADIDAFAARQGLRVAEGYQVISPLLIADADELNDVWGALRPLRYTLPDDIQALRAEAIARAGRGEDPTALDYPTYAPLPWE